MQNYSNSSEGSSIAFVATDGFPSFLPDIMFLLSLASLELVLVFGFIQHRRPISMSVETK